MLIGCRWRWRGPAFSRVVGPKNPTLQRLSLQTLNHTFINEYRCERFYAKSQREEKVKRNKYAQDEEGERKYGVKGGGPADKEKSEKRLAGHGDPSRTVLTIRDLTKVLPDGRVLFEDVSLSFYAGAKIGILGMNGAGKSSLMKVIAGVDDDYDGEVNFVKGIRVGYLAQEPALDDTKTVRQNILSGIPEMAPLIKYFETKEKLESKDLKDSEKPALEEQFAQISKVVEELKLLDSQWQIERAISALRCPPGESKVKHLSGGERRRVALARLLLAKPDILLLDEPTNHLDAASVAWLEHFLAQYKGVVLAITHDRYFLDNVAGWILEIEGGRCYPFEGNYSQWLYSKQQRLELEKRKEAVLSKQLKAELDWIHKTPKGRQTKSKARMERFEEMRARQRTKNYEPGVIVIPSGPRLGNEVIAVEGISKSVSSPTNQKRVLFENLSFKLTPGSIIGIVGPNGSGKTTLLNILGGIDAPDNGNIKIGQTVKLGFATQSRDSLNPYNTVYEEISQGNHEMPWGDSIIPVRKYVASFNFKAGQQDKRVADLSGGERNRVHLAKMLKSNSNVILLDEPTNDIDVEVLRSLEEGIQDYPGSIVVVSHDRWFLDRVATHILAFEDGGVMFFEGNYSEYEKDKTEVRGIRESFVFRNITKRGTW
eukprot:TRINITY_DN6481_c0_g1_i1.p1 TRINITY_DN6481_c0_g1~~TRINITY_DN6481_c0_g1_i1.p1  ORF type:complete len:655 (+),score=129.97 TRINITY_DN6481_c0_g1_i1:94-2058(+)